MSAHAPFTFTLLQAESRSMSVILFTRKHKSQRSRREAEQQGKGDVGGSVFGVGMSVCGQKDCQRLPCEMKHIITLRPAHVWDAGSRMPDAECPSQQPTATATAQRSTSAGQPKKGYTTRQGEAVCRVRSVGCEQLWFVRVNCKILFDMPWIAQAEQRVGLVGDRERRLVCYGSHIDCVCRYVCVCVRSGHKKCVLPPRGQRRGLRASFRWSNPIIKNFKLCTVKRTFKAHTRTRLLAHQCGCECPTLCVCYATVCCVSVCVWGGGMV